MGSDTTTHWNAAYEFGDEVSWFQDAPRVSLELVDSVNAGAGAAIVDVGGGSSRLVDALLDDGHTDVSVLDVSPNALALAQQRLGARADVPDWIVADILGWRPARSYDVWHDRAVLHFLTNDDDRACYRSVLSGAVRVGGHVVIGVFAEDGPDKCSGLEVRRYSRDELENFLGDDFKTTRVVREDHRTPSGKIQHFNWIVARRESG